jgi:Putative bacterial sensory transduction regulator
MRFLLSLLVIACSLFLNPQVLLAQVGPKGGGGTAAGGLISRITAEQLAGILSQAGYPSQVRTQQNEKYVVSDMKGVTVNSILYTCNNQGCLSFDLVVYASDQLTTDFVNAWNDKKRFTKASVDPSDGTLTLASTVVLSGGVSAENIKEYARFYEAMLGVFAQFQP